MKFILLIVLFVSAIFAQQSSTKGCEMCGGFAGFTCSDTTMVCHYNDLSCSPSNGGADCAGICVYPGTTSCTDKEDYCQTCGGIAGTLCKDSTQVCVDNPADDCSVANGGADCGGICVYRENGLCSTSSTTTATGCICAEIYSPVCGVDGNTYSNQCELECRGVKLDYEGECKQTTSTGCVCPAVYDPVCGVDGNTYGNTCELGCKKVDLDYEGECEKPTYTGCICPLVYAPVCGVDGKTYGNTCELKCEGVALDYEGECGAIPCPEVLCAAACKTGQVYGTDSNGCQTCECVEDPCHLMDCAPGYVCESGQCIQDCPFMICDCMEGYSPYYYEGKDGCQVCGCQPTYQPGCETIRCMSGYYCGYIEDQSSYGCIPNEKCDTVTMACDCAVGFASVAYRDNSGCETCNCQTEIPSDCALMLCEEGTTCGYDEQGQAACLPNKASCSCTKIYKPVCGVDGETYSNECVLDCQNVDLDYEGACETATTGAQCMCAEIYSPVCGVNGVTYENQCQLECKGVALDFEGNCDDDNDAQTFALSFVALFSFMM